MKFVTCHLLIKSPMFLITCAQLKAKIFHFTEYFSCSHNHNQLINYNVFSPFENICTRNGENCSILCSNEHVFFSLKYMGEVPLVYRARDKNFPNLICIKGTRICIVARRDVKVTFSRVSTYSFNKRVSSLFFFSPKYRFCYLFSLCGLLSLVSLLHR